MTATVEQLQLQLQQLTTAISHMAACLGTRLSREQMCDCLNIHRNTLARRREQDRTFPTPGKDGRWLLSAGYLSGSRTETGIEPCRNVRTCGVVVNHDALGVRPTKHLAQIKHVQHLCQAGGGCVPAVVEGKYLKLSPPPGICETWHPCVCTLSSNTRFASQPRSNSRLRRATVVKGTWGALPFLVRPACNVQ